MYFLKIVNFSEDPVKEEPATAAPPLQKQVGESPLLKLWDESDTLFSR